MLPVVVSARVVGLVVRLVVMVRVMGEILVGKVAVSPMVMLRVKGSVPGLVAPMRVTRRAGGLGVDEEDDGPGPDQGGDDDDHHHTQPTTRALFHDRSFAARGL